MDEPVATYPYGVGCPSQYLFVYSYCELNIFGATICNCANNSIGRETAGVPDNKIVLFVF